jgi:hypothetical protein
MNNFEKLIDVLMKFDAQQLDAFLNSKEVQEILVNK